MPHISWPTWTQAAATPIRAPSHNPVGTEATLQPAPCMEILVEPFCVLWLEPWSASCAPSRVEAPQIPLVPPMPLHITATLQDEVPGTHHHHYYQAPPSEGPLVQDTLT